MARWFRLGFLTVMLAGMSGAAFAAVHEVRAGESIKAAIGRAKPGDTINVRAGLYQESNVLLMKALTVRSADGPGKARIDAGGKGKVFHLWQCQDVTIDGFECFHAGENLIQVAQSKNCRLLNLHVHDAGSVGDCIKINDKCEDILVEGSRLHGPGWVENSEEVEECVDIMHSRRVTVRGCWLYATGKEQRANQLGYSKADCSEIVWEGNVIGPAHPTLQREAALGGGWAGESASGFNTIGVTYRNNIFLDCPKGALGIYGQKDVRVLHNLFLNCGRQQAVIEVHEGGGAKASENVVLAHNLFVDYEGALPARGIMAKTNGALKDLVTVGNLYFNAGKPIPSQGCYDPNREAEALLADPFLPLRAVAVDFEKDTAATIMARLRPLPQSPVKDAVRAKPGVQGLPEVAVDIAGTKRPQGPAADLGCFELAAAQSRKPEAPAASGVPARQAQARVEAAALAPWREKLKLAVIAASKAGIRSKVHLQILGASKEVVIVDAGEKNFQVELQGTRLPALSWTGLKLEDELHLARAVAREGDAPSQVLAAVFALACVREDLADEHFAVALKAENGKPLVEAARASLAVKP